MTAVGATDIGRRRKDNQDNYYIDVRHNDEQAFLVVCDGMGGAKSGNIASDMAVNLFAAEVKKRQKPGMSFAYMRDVMAEAIQNANRLTYEKSNEDADCTGMGSTMVAVLVDGSDACFLNVGDSRAYHFSLSGVRQITQDHSLVQMMVLRGELTAEQAKNFPGKNLITRAVGTEPEVEGDVFTQELRKDECLLLCSDGLSNEMADQEMLFEVAHGQRRSDCCQRLMHIAKHRGAPDNVTLVLASM